MTTLPATVLLLASLAVSPRATGQAPSDEALIRQARAASNQAIARHDVPAIVAFLAEEFQVSASNGTFMRGPEETGSWTAPGGPFRTGGRYAASWRKVAGKWLIHSELFVPLFCSGPECP